MYPVTWDPETGAILLTDHAGPGTIQGEIRPVFFEELDLLRLHEHWTYPHSSEPLLWAVGRRYYHCGQPVAEAKGGGFFEAPQVLVHHEDLHLAPVDVLTMLTRNAALLEGLAFRSLEFIHDQYHRRRRRTDIFAVAFSGGKDSLVVLDLVQRALAPDEFVVVFADTTMELQVTYDAIEQAQQCYPNLHFHVARSHLTALESWRLFGPPSRMHRWCCSVHKTAPTMLKLREIMDSPAVDAVVFDGCRREESQRRFGYTPVSAGCKHPTQVNISPILEWNSAEIWLYLLSRKLNLNQGYRTGFARIGCAVCPLASPWWDGLAWMAAREAVQPYVDMLLDLGSSMGIPESELQDFVTNGGWHGRAGGRALAQGGNRVLVTETRDHLSLRLRDSSEDWFQWAKTLGTIRRESTDSGTILSTRDGCAYPFRLTRYENALEIDVSELDTADRFLRRDLRSIAYKVAYCVHCRACEAECPTGTLRIDGRVTIDENRCINCSNCLGFVYKGCWAAKSLSVTEEATPMRLKTYQHFGMRQKWLDEFLTQPTSWWHENSLGPRQFDAMRTWLVDAELSASNQITDLGRLLQRLGGAGSLLAWAVVWCNLVRNSTLVNWYVRQVPWQRSYSRVELVEMLPGHLSTSTRENAVRALVGLLRDTPIGSELGLGYIEIEGGNTKSITKQGARQVPPLAVLYSLYRYAELLQRYDLSLSELAQGAEEGPAAVFGLGVGELGRCLRGLSTQHPAWIRVELVRDLDSIFLEPANISTGVLSLA